MFTAAVKADLGVLQNLKVQLSYCTIRAPISGQISQAAVDAGNLVRAADTIPIATINQIAPVYITFRVAQSSLPAVRAALEQDIAVLKTQVEQFKSQVADLEGWVAERDELLRERDATITPLMAETLRRRLA
jgi:multidrug efflux pump subunit AcrA (membrane-fusion protein)